MSGSHTSATRAVTTSHLKPGVKAEVDAAVKVMLPDVKLPGGIGAHQVFLGR